jgi:apolipoprotein N-acyltransferase
LKFLSVSCILIFVSVFCFGVLRIRNGSNNESIKVGLVVLDEKFHNITEHPDFQKELLATQDYSTQVANLAEKGSKIVLLPERAININKETEKEIIGILSKTAKQHQVYIIIGYTNFRFDKPLNSSFIIDTTGSIIGEYNKIHLVKGLEDLFMKGNKNGIFNFNKHKVGIPICKDLDFPNYISEYSQVSFLTIPAWDFVVDGWLHSRMAILRGVENGFAEIRTARQGKLTISNRYGKVIYEADCSKGKAQSLLGNLPLQNESTFYARFGDWFAIANLMGLTFLLFIILRNRYSLTQDDNRNKQ